MTVRPNEDFLGKRKRFGAELVSLETLLSPPSSSDSSEDSFEVALVAEAFKEMLDVRFGRAILGGLLALVCLRLLFTCLLSIKHVLLAVVHLPFAFMIQLGMLPFFFSMFWHITLGSTNVSLSHFLMFWHITLESTDVSGDGKVPRVPVGVLLCRSACAYCQCSRSSGSSVRGPCLEAAGQAMAGSKAPVLTRSWEGCRKTSDNDRRMLLRRRRRKRRGTRRRMMVRQRQRRSHALRKLEAGRPADRATPQKGRRMSRATRPRYRSCAFWIWHGGKFALRTGRG